MTIHFSNCGDEWDYSADWNMKFEKIIKDYGPTTEADKTALDKMDWWRFSYE